MNIHAGGLFGLVSSKGTWLALEIVNIASFTKE